MTKKQINIRKRSTWKWFAVKLLYEGVISGEPSPETIDQNYSRDFKNFEESIILVKAQSFDQAYSIAEKKAKEAEIDYQNPYDESVHWQLIKALDAFWLFDDELVSGTELYSRIIRVAKSVDNDEVIKNLYPETAEVDVKQPDYGWIYRIKEFSERPGKRK